MKNGFTKLELILIVTLMVSAVLFLLNKNSKLLPNNEQSLRDRYSKLTSLINSKNYSEAYNFFDTSTRNKYTREEHIKLNNENSNTTNQRVTVNNVTIRGNVGFIDRSNEYCGDSKCTSKVEIRGYKKWVFENGDWYYSTPDPRCIREEMYDMPEEFKRALSLIKQRLSNKMGENSGDFSFFNCLNIQYSDLKEAEGVFTFVPGQSTIDKLNILVNKSYKSSDDLLTALLLSHEAMHASNYIDLVSNNIKTDCVDEEVKAFTMQLVFSASLTEGEMKSLNLKLNQGYNKIDNRLKIMWDLLTYRDYARKMCNTIDYDECFFKYFNSKAKNMITNNPYYQKQCNL
ncbi:MAG: hypothetical protein HQK53_19845 [Oligoflexia bacterium]|nr:hypothetical protein [Oligoflexia bacterium]